MDNAASIAQVPTGRGQQFLGVVIQGIHVAAWNGLYWTLQTLMVVAKPAQAKTVAPRYRVDF
jgi:hypothetical protein